MPVCATFALLYNSSSLYLLVRLAEKRNSVRGFGGSNNLNNNNYRNNALYRSSRNLDWVKSKWNSIKSNLHEASIQLHTASSAGQCDPYVSVRLVPRQGTFLGIIAVSIL